MQEANVPACADEGLATSPPGIRYHALAYQLPLAACPAMSRSPGFFALVQRQGTYVAAVGPQRIERIQVHGPGSRTPSRCCNRDVKCAGRARPHRIGPRHGERQRSHEARRPDWRRATDEVWRRRGFTGVHGSARRHLPARVGWPGRPGPGEATGLGQLSGLLPAGDLLMYAVSCGAGRWLVRDETRIRGSGCGSLVALRRPVLAVADRAGSIAPIGVQLVKYVLHLLNGTGRPARRAGCPHRATEHRSADQHRRHERGGWGPLKPVHGRAAIDGQPVSWRYPFDVALWRNSTTSPSRMM